MDAPGPSDRSERQNLGWLAQSGMQPRKRKEIEGVSNKSILGLQASLYQQQEQARLRKEGVSDVSDRHVRRKAGIDVSLLKSNPGVEARDRNDRLHIKTADEKVAESQAALERKAQIYDRLARGEGGTDDERYEVDFLRKGGWLGDDAAALHEPQRRSMLDDAPLDTTGMAVGGTGAMMSSDMARERERRQWEEQEHRQLQVERDTEERRRQHKEAVLDIAEQTREEREYAARAKQRAEQQQDAKKEALLKHFVQQHKGHLGKMLGATKPKAPKEPG